MNEEWYGNVKQQFSEEGESFGDKIQSGHQGIVENSFEELLNAELYRTTTIITAYHLPREGGGATNCVLTLGGWTDIYCESRESEWADILCVQEGVIKCCVF